MYKYKVEMVENLPEEIKMKKSSKSRHRKNGSDIHMVKPSGGYIPTERKNPFSLTMPRERTQNGSILFGREGNSVAEGGD